MDTIAKKGRYFLLAAAILAYLGAVGVVVNQILSVIFSRIVTENLGEVLGLYSQFTAVVGAMFGGAVPCILLVLALRHTSGRSKLGFFLLACGAGLSVVLMCLMFFADSGETTYQMGMLSAGVTGLLYIAGDILLAADRQNSGTVRGIAVAAAVFALFTAVTKIAANGCGYMYLLTYKTEPWIRVLSLASSANLFVAIIGAVLDGSKLMLLFALPVVKEPEAAAENGEGSESEQNETP